jgi:SUKH-4 immunity protein
LVSDIGCGVGSSASLSIVAAGNLPGPPDFESVEAWAGVGRVIRAGASDVARWRLPPEQKAALTSCGVPLLEGVVDITLFAAEPRDGRYCLAGTRGILYHPGYVYLAEPETGLVSELESSSGHLRFVNSSINHWLCSLHLVGTWFSSSTAIRTWDEDEAMEHVALAELSGLLQRIRHLDPPAYGHVGDHETHYWPAVIDRWLY